MRVPGTIMALRPARYVPLMRPLVGTGTKSASPIQSARSEKATRIASAITLSVLTEPKP